MLVKNFKIESLAPKISPKDNKELMPDNLHPYKASFEITGINEAVSNGLRRVIMTELPVKALYFDLDDLSTTDPFTLNDFVQTRLRNIPIDQKIPLNATFNLDFQNNTEDLIAVKSGNLQIKPGSTVKKLPFNIQYTLAEIKPNTNLKINNISVKRAHGYDFGGHTVAFSATSIPLDATPYNGFTKTGQHSSVANPKHFRITFISNGNMEAKEIVKESCNEIIMRLKMIMELLKDDLHKLDNEYKLNIHGESDTTGNLIMRTVCDLYPDIPAITYDMNHISRILSLRIKLIMTLKKY